MNIECDENNSAVYIAAIEVSGCSYNKRQNDFTDRELYITQKNVSHSRQKSFHLSFIDVNLNSN